MRTTIITAFAITLTAAGQAKGGEPIRVTVYNKANMPAETLRQTATSVESIFRHSGVEIRWVEGNAEAVESTVLIYTSMPESRNHALRLACMARRDIALAIIPAAPSSVPVSTLGVAQPYAPEGINVRVYRDHIGAAAARAGVALPELMGHAIAHEIGHVLLRSNGHDGVGIMAGVWKDREYAWINQGSLFFNLEEAPTMIATIRGQSCLESASRK